MISRARVQILGVAKSSSLLWKSRVQIKQLEWVDPGKRFSCNNKGSLAAKLGLEYHICRLRQCLDCLSPWYILHKLGVPRGPVIKFRRFLLRHSYPWITYCLPTASIMMIGDMVAQLLYAKVKYDGCPRPYDFLSTLKYGLLGFFVVGPIISKWDLFTFRKLQCMKVYKFLMAKILLDTLILSPLLIALVMAAYDAQYISENFDHVERLQCKFTTAFTNIMLLNLLTRPIMMLTLCCLFPPCIRRQVRGLYEIFFMTYISRMLRCHYFGLSSDEIRVIQKAQRKMKGDHTGFCETVRKLLGCMCPTKPPSTCPPPPLPPKK